MSKTTCNLEVLAPAGDFDSVIAAVQNGANAVYLGQKVFSARQNAKNFDKDELLNAVSYCHSRDVKVYQTLNTLIFDTQLNDALTCIKTACDCSVDAFIVQDLGLISMIREISPTVPIHASTQMAVHTVMGAQLLKDLSVKRVVLARELSLEQIKEISQTVEIETEVFVHGALCMSVSGQCYISSMIGTRSGNRGSCAGTCRLPFSSSDTPANDLSLKDLCLASHIDELKEAGVTSVKIEGRMKRPEYVAAASKVYSNANRNEDYDIDTLQAVFSRSGFTDGYLKNRLGETMFGIRQKDDVMAATNKVLKSLENSYKKEVGLVPLNMDITLKRNMPVTLTATDNHGNTTTTTSDIPELAMNKSASEESLIASLSKLGGTIFKAGNIACSIDDGLAFPVSKLNELRRVVCEEIASKRGIVTPVTCNDRFTMDKKTPQKADFSLRARFERVSQIPFERMRDLEYIILPIDEVCDNSSKLLLFKEKVLIEPYRAMYMTEEDNFKKLSKLKEQGFSMVYANNLAHIKMAQELSMTIFGGAYLNCGNSLAAKSYKELGVVDLTLSFELNIETAKKIYADIPLGLFLYGYLPLMLLKNCPIKNQFNCKDCNSNKMLTDRMGMRFKIICNRQKYSELLNCNPLYMADRLHEVAPLSFGILYFTTENMAQCD
ncbi:MAG: DUF3656 domain-containing protein, partial [Oscillospiraceae bacterium]